MNKVAIAVAFALAAQVSLAAGGPTPKHSISLTPLASYVSGVGGATGAEIVAYDAASRRMFSINTQDNSLDVVDLANPAAPTRIARLPLGAYGGGVNSVAVHDGLVAIATDGVTSSGVAAPQDPGKVVFFDAATLAVLGQVGVGAMPDMLTFTPSGERLLVANEGEPNGAYSVDPEGSVSIIRIPANRAALATLGRNDVRTADFRAFNGKEAELRAQGIRIYGPGANAAKDLEPEYITVSQNSRTAYVTLQEANAIAVVDVASATVTRLIPLGYKDFSTLPEVATYEFGELPPIGTTLGGQTLTLGGFSGLFYEGSTPEGRLRFVTHTDRGPNAEPTGLDRPFLLPDFTPRIVRFELDPETGAFELTQQILLKRPDGTPLTGLPNLVTTANPTSASQPYNDERPVDLKGAPIGRVDPLGADLEGVAIDPDGNFWMCDEYRPAIYKFAADGTMLARFVPIGTHAAAGANVPAAGQAGVYGIEALPPVLGQRRQNRGFEGLALQNGLVYAMVQSPARNPASLSNATLNALQNVRLVELNPVTLATRQFLYVMDNPAPLSATNDTRADKIGDLAAIPGGQSGGFLAVERDDDAAPVAADKVITKKVYGFALSGAGGYTATNIGGTSGGQPVDRLYTVTRGGVAVQVSLDQMTSSELSAAGITPLRKTLRVDLAEAGYDQVQKVEGLAVLAPDLIAVINDNDFGVASITVNPATGVFTPAPGYVPEKPLLGIVRNFGFDASDRDGIVNIRDWPVFGMYQPDAIASFQVRGETYLVLANEGDARDYNPGLQEEAAVGAAGVVLDPTRFPPATATALKAINQLGRLTVTNRLGDTDGDGDYDRMYMLGSRSVTLRKADGTIVWDSGTDFERLTAERFPQQFNASNGNTTFDDRSDAKGPEPEGVAVGRVSGRTYAFVALERIGGVMVYDVTDPQDVSFVDYVNTRSFSGDALPGQNDSGPEGVTFIPEKASPNGKPLLLVGNETSKTVAIFQVDRFKKKD